MKQRKFNRKSNKGTNNSNAKETKPVFDEVEVVEFDDEFFARHRDEFSAQTMMLQMHKTPDEIELEEHEACKKDNQNSGTRNSDLVFDALQASQSKFEAYLQLTGVGKLANFYVKALLIQKFPEDRFVNNVIMAHLDMLQGEILKQRMQIGQLTGEGIEPPTISPEYALKSLDDVQRDNPDFFPGGREDILDQMAKQECSDKSNQ